MSRVVVNLSDRVLSDSETSILAKGGNFAIVPRYVPSEDIIANIEASVRKLNADEAEEVRRETSRILHKAKPPKCNISSNERKALIVLNRDKSIVILSADKGNATAILNSTDYNKKIMDLLDPESYKVLKRDPTASILRKTNSLIKNSSIPDEAKKNLVKSEALAPRLYGLPKIHKPDVPLRPIVSAIGSPTYLLSKYLTTLLNPYVGNTDSFVRDSTQFVEKLTNLTLKSTDILVSFDVVSLFTMVPINETMELLRKIFPEDISAMFHHVLTATYFQWNQNFYEQTDGVAMGSPLSPVVANFFMEWFEELALTTSNKKPMCWLRYVDDTFVVWSHGSVELENFLMHINNIHPKIKFTMETETDGKLPFLDVMVYRRKDGTLGHGVYRKPTHTDRYLHKTSNHHPRQKRGILKTLFCRANRICDSTLLDKEIAHLKTTFEANGYSKQEIHRALRPKNNISTLVKEPTDTKGTAYLPYVKNVTDRIDRVLRRHNIKTIFKPTRKISTLLRSVKDTRSPLCSAGVYRIPCSCGAAYIGTTGRSINTRIKEHIRHCKYGHTDKSAVAEHAFSEGNHDIQFQDTSALSTTHQYYPRLHREAIEIFKHPNNFNRKEEGVKLNKLWHPVLRQRSKTKNNSGRAYPTNQPMGNRIPAAFQSPTNPRAPGTYKLPRHFESASDTPSNPSLKPFTGGEGSEFH